MRSLAFLALAGLVSVVSANESFNFGSFMPIGSWDGPGDTSNRTVNLASSASAPYILSERVTGINAALQVLIGATYASEAAIRVRNSGHSGLFADFTVFDEQSYSGTITTSNTERILSGALVGQQILPGTTWSFEFYETFDDGANANDQNWTALSFAFTGFGPPTPTHDFGNVQRYTSKSFTANHSGDNKIRWYSMTLTQNASAHNRIVIDTEGTPLAGIDDTQIALYNEAGDVIAQDDDSGTGFLSRLEFDGSSGKELLAGTYLIGVAPHRATFRRSWDASTTSTRTGDIRVNVQAVPEPGTMAALAAGIGLILRRSRRSRLG